MSEVIRLENSSMEPIPTITTSSEYVRGIGKYGERLLILLDVNTLFGSKEIEELKMVI